MPYDVIIGRDKADKEKFGDKGLVFIGKGYVSMGNYTSLSNLIWLDVARSHIIMICGKRGCLAEGTMVFTDKGYRKIKDFNQKEDKVLSFNKDKKEFEWESAELLTYPVKNEKLLEIEFQDGRRIKLTKEHPLLMNYGKYLFWRQANQLKVNDKIVLPISLPEIKKDSESFKIARILGFALSDGTISKRAGKWKDGRGYWYNGIKSRLRIFCDDENVLRTAKEDIEKEFGLHTKRYKRNDCNCSVIQSLHAKVIDKIHNLGVPFGNKAGIIRIPEIVWRSSNEFKANFLSALFSCDGFIAKTGKTIDYSSKSRKFLEDMQCLLSHFGIESVIRDKNAKCNNKIYKNYRLFITDNTSIENFKQIGFISKFKQERLEKHKGNNKKRKKTFYYSDNLVCKKIISIKEISDIKEVYDLSVNKNHSFIANGIISHNSGKSYSIGAIAEELCDLPPEISKNIAPLIFDTMGIFWTMKFKNEKEAELLQEWNLKPKNLPVVIWVPYGRFDEYEKRQIPVDKKFALEASELNAEDWILAFNLSMIDPISILIQEALGKLKENYSLEDIIDSLKNIKSDDKTKMAALSLFNAAKTWGIFAEKNQKGTEIEDLIKPGVSTILDVSTYSSIGNFNVRALVIGLVSKKIFNQRMLARKKEEMLALQHGADYMNINEKRESPLVWIFIDEIHEFLPNDSKTAATDALIQILREGRQPGLSMVMATQQPGVLHRDAMTQSDVILSHRVTAKPDIDALNSIMQTYLLESIKQSMDNLPSLKGSAIILDDNSERIYPMRVRPRFTWHGGESPTSVKVQKRI